jgi:hypothetical protein
VVADPGTRGPRTTARVCRWLTVALQLGLGVAAVVFAVGGQPGRTGLLAVALALTATPLVLRWLLRRRIPSEFGFVLTLFVFLAMFLGTGLRFYDRFWWWDSALHATSGFLLGLVGLVIAYSLARPHLQPDQLPIRLPAVFAFLFAGTIGVGWEIFEFAADTLVSGSNMQVRQTGVADTMVDLIMNVLGAAVISVLGYVQGRSGRYGFPLRPAIAFVSGAADAPVRGSGTPRANPPSRPRARPG